MPFFSRIYLFVVTIFVLMMPGRAVATDGCDTTVWFVNIYPGSEIYELEGHSALRIKTCEWDMAVNYGMFSFDSPNFIYRFVKGETDYMVGAIPWEYFIAGYIQTGRRVVAHELGMTSEQKARLIDLVAENLKPENRVYRYNYVLDNCATRPLRMVELAMGDTLILSEPVTEPSLKTFRDYMQYYHSNYPWYQFGIDIALGKGIDRPINVREKAFAPVVLESQIDETTVGATEGHKLIVDKEVLFDAEPFGVVLPGTPWYMSPVFVFWVIALLLTCYSVRLVFHRHRYPRLVATLLFTLYGLAGLLVAFLVFVSVHEATSPNVNLLWLNPLCFIPVVGLWLKKAKKLNYWYFLINFVLLIGVIVLWVAGYQEPNSGFIPLVLVDMLFSALYIYQLRFDCEKN